MSFSDTLVWIIFDLLNQAIVEVVQEWDEHLESYLGHHEDSISLLLSHHCNEIIYISLGFHGVILHSVP